MITAPAAHVQMLALTVHYPHGRDACEQLAAWLDEVAASTGDRYYAGLGDGLRISARIAGTFISAQPRVWN